VEEKSLPLLETEPRPSSLLPGHYIDWPTQGPNTLKDSHKIILNRLNKHILQRKVNRFILCQRQPINRSVLYTTFNKFQKRWSNLLIWKRQCSVSAVIILRSQYSLSLVKEFSAFYGTWKFSAVFIRSRHWSLSWARWIQSIPSKTNYLRSIIILL
jgi:hypothetical protein